MKSSILVLAFLGSAAVACAAADNSSESSALPEMKIVGAPMHPALVEQVMPEYPYWCRRGGAEGRVSIDMVVDNNGRVRNVTILDSDNQALSEAAREAVLQWKFVPASNRPKDYPRHATVTFNFVLEPAGGIAAAVRLDGAS
jgi:protein TonB